MEDLGESLKELCSVLANLVLLEAFLNSGLGLSLLVVLFKAQQQQLSANQFAQEFKDFYYELAKTLGLNAIHDQFEVDLDTDQDLIINEQKQLMPLMDQECITRLISGQYTDEDITKLFEAHIELTFAMFVDREAEFEAIKDLILTASEQTKHEFATKLLPLVANIYRGHYRFLPENINFSFCAPLKELNIDLRNRTLTRPLLIGNLIDFLDQHDEIERIKILGLEAHDDYANLLYFLLQAQTKFSNPVIDIQLTAETILSPYMRALITLLQRSANTKLASIDSSIYALAVQIAVQNINLGIFRREISGFANPWYPTFKYKSLVQAHKTLDRNFFSDLNNLFFLAMRVNSLHPNAIRALYYQAFVQNNETALKLLESKLPADTCKPEFKINENGVIVVGPVLPQIMLAQMLTRYGATIVYQGLSAQQLAACNSSIIQKCRTASHSMLVGYMDFLYKRQAEKHSIAAAFITGLLNSFFGAPRESKEFVDAVNDLNLADSLKPFLTKARKHNICTGLIFSRIHDFVGKTQTSYGMKPIEEIYAEPGGSITTCVLS